ncbi:permease [Mesoterricola sediminis]|uniref:Permease n=1 Tax=Mesoterricola sediminis TaxID=2927980 RepID=A0AA48H2T9_9BACT|nr:permease [Mesoterricola sediminis]BDU76441.1 permease [Mesoterricola sediminis]
MRIVRRESRAVLTEACCGGAGGCGCSVPPAGAGRGLADWVRWAPPVLAAGVALYLGLEPLARFLTARVLGLDPASRLGGAVAFFLYDAPKVLLLLGAVTFAVAFLQSFLDPARTRALLARRRGAAGNLLASLFGILTPFCSCSAVPLFIGLVRVGVPLGVTFSYLVAAPMINEVALVLLLAMFGWKLALLYAGTGVALAAASGWILGRFDLASAVEPWVAEGRADSGTAPAGPLGLAVRLDRALAGARETVGKVWPYALAGIGVGAFLHGYIPEGLLAGFMGRGSWWTVPLAVLIGVPLYASTAVVLPIVQTLLAKGAALGTVLAFMMAVTALSLPEVILLRRVLRPRLIALFLGVVTVGIIGVGWLFNARL